MRIKIDKRDVIFSKLVRERASWSCEFCNRHFGDATRGLECAHIYGRSRKGMRWLPLNAVALCTGHHMHFTGNPLEFAAWVEGHIGKANAETLRIMAGQTYKLSKADLEDIHQNLKAELRRVEMLRAGGKTGRVEFDSPYPERIAA